MFSKATCSDLVENKFLIDELMTECPDAKVSGKFGVRGGRVDSLYSRLVNFSSTKKSYFYPLSSFGSFSANSQ